MNSRQDDLSSCLSTQKFKSKLPNPNSNSECSVEQTDLDTLQKPLSEEITLNKSVKRNPTELNHRWEEKRRLYHIKQRTLFRIYITKWWFKGLEWFEYELLILLAKNLNKNIQFLEREVYPARTEIKGERTVYLGGHSSNKMEIPDYEIIDRPVLAAYQTGERIFATMTINADTNEFEKAFCEIGEDIYFDLYNLLDFQAIWKLRSFQGLRDAIFVPFQSRSIGKTGIKKPRIRGYTDGRGSAGDPKRLRLARQVDVVFWQEKFEQKWKDFYTEVEKLANGSTDPL